MNEWHSYHIFYFDGLLQEKLICECIAPLMKEYLEKKAIEKWFFIRYWEGGPHVRLRFLGGADVEEEIVSRIKRFVEENKSDSTLTKEDYYRNHTFDGEDLDRSKLPWYENNSIQAISYEREYERYGGEVTIPVCESLFMSSSIMASDLIAATRSNMGQRISIALNLIIVFLYELEIKPEYFFFYYKDLWDKFFKYSDLEASYFGTLNVRSRLSSITEGMSSNPLYVKWCEMTRTDVATLKEIWKDNPERLYGIVMSLVHMFNNRLGIIPNMERQICAQFTKEVEAMGHAMENR